MEIDSIGDDLDNNTRYSFGTSDTPKPDPYALGGRSATPTPPSLANKVSRLACAMGGYSGGGAHAKVEVTIEWGRNEGPKVDFEGKFGYDKNGYQTDGSLKYDFDNQKFTSNISTEKNW